MQNNEKCSGVCEEMIKNGRRIVQIALWHCRGFNENLTKLSRRGNGGENGGAKSGFLSESPGPRALDIWIKYFFGVVTFLEDRGKLIIIPGHLAAFWYD